MSDQETFWKRLDHVNAGMLGCAPDWRLVPMSHYADPDAKALWFITAKGTDLVNAAEGGARDAVHVVADAGKHLYARIEGRLESSDNAAKLDEIWNAVASAWFEDGKRDDDLRLLKFSISSAEVWATTSGVGFFYQTAKAKLTGAKPDMGEHFRVGFA